MPRLCDHLYTQLNPRTPITRRCGSHHQTLDLSNASYAIDAPECKGMQARVCSVFHVRTSQRRLVIDILMPRKHLPCVLLWTFFVESSSLPVQWRRAGRQKSA